MRAVVLTGAGGKAFCSGIDRDETMDGTIAEQSEEEQNHDWAGRVSTNFMFNDVGAYINPKQNDLWKPIITAVNGMACGERSTFSASPTSSSPPRTRPSSIRTSPTAWSRASRLCISCRRCRSGEALRIALLGVNERVSASVAREIGLVSEVVPADELLDRALWLGRAVASAPPLAIQGTLRAAWMARSAFRRDALDQVSALVCLGSPNENIEAGQEVFRTTREKPRLR